MDISQIYQKFSVPPNLAQHMQAVAKVVEIIKDNWTGPEVKWEDLEKMALLHDLGNIVKFKEPSKDQASMIAKYGTDDHEATRLMLTEINFPEELIEIILNKSFGNSVAISQSDNWMLKILYYADLRVLPSGIGTLDQRLEDIKIRMPKYFNRPDFPELIEACKDIEQQIKENVIILP